MRKNERQQATKRVREDIVEKRNSDGDFPGGPGAEASCCQCRGPGFDALSGNWIPHAATKSLYAATKTRLSQIKKYFFKRKNMDKISEARRSRTLARNQRCRKWWHSGQAPFILQDGKTAASQQLPSLHSLSHTGFSFDSQMSPTTISPILWMNYELGVIHTH